MLKVNYYNSTDEKLNKLREVFGDIIYTCCPYEIARIEDFDHHALDSDIIIKHTKKLGSNPDTIKLFLEVAVERIIYYYLKGENNIVHKWEQILGLYLFHLHEYTISYQLDMTEENVKNFMIVEMEVRKFESAPGYNQKIINNLKNDVLSYTMMGIRIDQINVAVNLTEYSADTAKEIYCSLIGLIASGKDTSIILTKIDYILLYQTFIYVLNKIANHTPQDPCIGNLIKFCKEIYHSSQEFGEVFGESLLSQAIMAKCSQLVDVLVKSGHSIAGALQLIKNESPDKFNGAVRWIEKNFGRVVEEIVPKVLSNRANLIEITFNETENLNYIKDFFGIGIAFEITTMDQFLVYISNKKNVENMINDLNEDWISFIRFIGVAVHELLFSIMTDDRIGRNVWLDLIGKIITGYDNISLSISCKKNNGIDLSLSISNKKSSWEKNLKELENVIISLPALITDYKVSVIDLYEKPVETVSDVYQHCEEWIKQNKMDEIKKYLVNIGHYRLYSAFEVALLRWKETHSKELLLFCETILASDKYLVDFYGRELLAVSLETQCLDMVKYLISLNVDIGLVLSMIESEEETIKWLENNKIFALN